MLCSTKIFFSMIILLRPAADSFEQTLYIPWKASLSPHGLHKIPLLFASTCDSGLRIGLVLLLLLLLRRPPLLYHALEEYLRPCRFLLRLRREKDDCTKVVVVVVVVRYFSMVLQAAAAEAASGECFRDQSLKSLGPRILFLPALLLGKHYASQNAELRLSNTHRRGFSLGVPPSPLDRSRCSGSIWSGLRRPSTLWPSWISSVRWRGKSRGQRALFVYR